MGRGQDLIAQHHVKFHLVNGYDGHPENDRCDELAGIAIKSDDLIEDDNYEPKEKTEPTGRSHRTKSSRPKIKIEKEGDLCRNCGIPAIKRTPKKKKRKPDQTYYFEYYLYCTSCRAMYLVEEAKREISDSDQQEFE